MTAQVEEASRAARVGEQAAAVQLHERGCVAHPRDAVHSARFYTTQRSRPASARDWRDARATRVRHARGTTPRDRAAGGRRRRARQRAHHRARSRHGVRRPRPGGGTGGDRDAVRPRRPRPGLPARTGRGDRASRRRPRARPRRRARVGRRRRAGPREHAPDRALQRAHGGRRGDRRPRRARREQDPDRRRDGRQPRPAPSCAAAVAIVAGRPVEGGPRADDARDRPRARVVRRVFARRGPSTVSASCRRRWCRLARIGALGEVDYSTALVALAAGVAAILAFETAPAPPWGSRSR